MKRISQNKFASSLFSCLGVAACVAFSSCGKKDNDQFKNANEFAEFLKSKANNENIDLGESNLETFAKANWKTASKKTFQFTEAIKKQIAEEDLDNEDEEMTDPDQSNPEQQNPGTEQQKPEQPNPGTEHPKPTTTDHSGTETISDDKTLSELIKIAGGKHVGVKVNDICFDLNVFFEIYSWFEKHKGGSDQNLISSKDLKLDEAINMLKKCKKNVHSKFGGDADYQEVDVTSFVDKSVCQSWEQGNIYYFETNITEPAVYNNLLYTLVNGKDLGFKDVHLNTDKDRISEIHENKDVYEALVNLQKN